MLDPNGETEAGAPKEHPRRGSIENPVRAPVRRASFACGPVSGARAPEKRKHHILAECGSGGTHTGELVCDGGNRRGCTEACFHPAKIVSEEGLAPVQGLRSKSQGESGAVLSRTGL